MLNTVRQVFHIQYTYIVPAARHARKAHKRLAFLPVSKARTDKFIPTYIVFILQYKKSLKKKTAKLSDNS